MRYLIALVVFISFYCIPTAGVMGDELKTSFGLETWIVNWTINPETNYELKSDPNILIRLQLYFFLTRFYGLKLLL